MGILWLEIISHIIKTIFGKTRISLNQVFCFTKDFLI